MNILEMAMAAKMGGGSGGGGSSSWKDLGEGIVYDTVTWDGNTDGRAVYMDMAYHISDGVPTKEDLAKGFTVTLSNGNTVDSSTEGVIIQDIEEGAYAICILTFPVVGFNTIAQEGFPVGTYAFSVGGVHVTSITVNGFKGYEAVKTNPIDYKYLPEALQFGAEKQMIGSLTIDSQDIVLDELPTDSSGKFYKFSDFVPTADELMSATAMLAGQSAPINMMGELFTSGNGEVYGVVPLIVVTEAAVGFVEAIIPDFGISTFPEAGMYTISEFFGASITFPNVAYAGHGKLDNKYLDLAWLPTTYREFERIWEATFTSTQNVNIPNDVAMVLTTVDEIRVEINGELCTSKRTSEPGSVNGYAFEHSYFGNFHIGNSAYPDTGEPFFIQVTTMDGVLYTSAFKGNVKVETLAIDAAVLKYNTLPEEFLPGNTSNAVVPVLSGVSFGADEEVIATLQKAYDKDGVARCKYDGTIYSVIGMWHDVVDPNATLLLSRVGGALASSKGYFWISVLRYNLSDTAILKPILNRTEFYLDSSSYTNGEASDKRFKITVDDNGTITATEVTA